MHWTNKAWLLAGVSAVAAVVIVNALGAGWYSLIAGFPTFAAAGVVAPFFMDVNDPRTATRKSRRRRRRRKTPSARAGT